MGFSDLKKKSQTMTQQLSKEMEKLNSKGDTRRMIGSGRLSATRRVTVMP